MSARAIQPSDAGRGSRGRRVADRVARHLVSAGGITIIISILAILIVIAAQVAPLFRVPRARAEAAVAFNAGPALAGGCDEYLQLAHLVTSTGVSIHRLATGERIAGGVTQAIASVAGDPDRFALGLPDGRALPCSIHYNSALADGHRVSSASVRLDDAIEVLPAGHPLDLFSFAQTADGLLCVARSDSNELTVVAVTEQAGLIGGTTRDVTHATVRLNAKGGITALALDHRGEHAFVGTAGGELHVVDLANRERPATLGIPTPATKGHPVAITLLGLLIGDRTLVVGDQVGRVTSWQMLRRDGAFRLSPMREFAAHARAVTGFSASRRNKTFVTTDAGGEVLVRYGTTGRTLLRLAAPAPLTALALSPKGDALLGVAADGHCARWALAIPHPEITLGALFGKVLYEGYDKPAYVWQSTGGTDDFEPKFSLTPLIFGTLKGTLYAMLFAAPLALLAALYASQFMRPDVKQWIKPTVEIMAAMPSVVLGFIAGLWLAPAVERNAPGLLVMPFVIAACVLLTLIVWRRLPAAVTRVVRPGAEIALLVPVVLVACALALRLGGSFESAFLGGDYRLWVREHLGVTFDQRNSLVVGFAMGFAVVPVVFTIAEDALSSVPHHLKAASLALGATHWQTAVRVILPTASPGIFSALMIGLGRAVGETMIVLMATGNTPVMNWSVFNGFRALSANVAVELPEAPDGGTLFRVLFLAALLLYLLTFVLNTVAELVRLRLRNKYRVL